MEDREEYGEIMKALGRVESQTTATKEHAKEITDHLARLNGSVAKVVLDLAKHPYECKWGPQIEDIEMRLSTGNFHGSIDVQKALAAFNLKEAEKVGKNERLREVLEWCKPFIIAAIMTGLVLWAMHFEQISKVTK